MPVPLSRRALAGVAVLAVLAGAAVLPSALRADVRLAVDGAVTSVRTGADTVAEVLAGQGVELAAGDAVLPAAGTPVTDGAVIRVLRSIEVELDVDGTSSSVRGTFRTAAGALAAAGVVPGVDDLVEPAPDTVVADGDRIVVRSPSVVTLVVDGATLALRTHLTDVGRLLATHGVELGPVDLLGVDGVASSPAGQVADGSRVVVERVTSREEVRDVPVPFGTTTRETSELYAGASRVVEAGVDGVERQTWLLTLVDGAVTEEQQVRAEVVTAPVTEVVEQGTKPVPPPNAGYADDGSVWYDLAQCESGGRWNYDGASGFDGGLQFHPATWRRWKSADDPPYAYLATPGRQIAVAARYQSVAGWGPWPACRAKLGLP